VGILPCAVFISTIGAAFYLEYIMSEQKTCVRCKQFHPLTEFRLDVRMLSGRGSYCKKCRAEMAKEYRESHPNYVENMKKRKKELSQHRREWQREWYKKNKEKRAEALRKDRILRPEAWRKYHEQAKKANPLAHKSRKILETAVQWKGFEKPDTCSKCGKKFDSQNIHAHHEDYKKPLDIVWVCRSCHMKIHVLMREKNVESNNLHKI
jgi:predicted RNase H-like nuclease (RuvC/YqgF family)